MNTRKRYFILILVVCSICYSGVSAYSPGNVQSDISSPKNMGADTDITGFRSPATSRSFTSGDPATTFEWSKPTGSGISLPWGVITDSAGNTYVGDDMSFSIWKIAPDGTVLAKWGSYGTGNSQFSEIAGIALGNGGNIYVIDRDNHRVQVFDENGNYLNQWGTYGTGNSQFDAPIGIAVNSSGYVYVADTSNNRIQVFTPDGEYMDQWGSWGWPG